MAKTKTFSIPDQDAEVIASALKRLRELDLWSESRVIVEAIKEYAKNHLPGNPGVPLDHWTSGFPFSQTAREKLNPRLPKGVMEMECEVCNGEGGSCEACGGSGKFYYYPKKAVEAQWHEIRS